MNIIVIENKWEQDHALLNCEMVKSPNCFNE